MFSLLEYASIAINLHFFLRLDTRHPSDAFLHPVTQSQTAFGKPVEQGTSNARLG
jgi:hypothetical protein